MPEALAVTWSPVRSSSMPVEWTGSGRSCCVPLDRDGREPLRAQLERGLREAIRTGRLAAGERLPSSRELARELGVSRGLVVRLLRPAAGRGLPDRAGRLGDPRRRRRSRRRRRRRPGPAARRRGSTIDFLPGRARPGVVPAQRLGLGRRRGAAATAPTAALGYGDPRGAERAAHGAGRPTSRRVRGAAAGADRIVVCTGFAQGSARAARAGASAGVGPVAFEDPGRRRDGFGCAARRARRVGAGAGRRARRRASTRWPRTGRGAVVVTPAHQWPTGRGAGAGAPAGAGARGRATGTGS